MEIGTRIRELRLRAGLTQEGLAARIGVTPSAVGNYERGVSFPKEEVLMALFGALGCTPNELLGSGGFEDEHIRMYRALDELGRERVDRCTERELERCADDGETVLIAAREGGAPRGMTLKRRGERTIFDVPTYKGGR
ncbi:MAG: helix-turn-helix domain-containing protein [Lachnospiraceae bacterium]|nr:helix-turn-helix domain-containing protein [Ruminococcus sp.]MCM1275557.1 helix-turn-helix domain-containing protein [Lachnospiraceae bacterium]